MYHQIDKVNSYSLVVYGQLCSEGVEAAFSWGQSYVFMGSKLCSLYGNAIEKDCSLRRE